MKHGKKIIMGFYSSMTGKAGEILLPHYGPDVVRNIAKDCESRYDGIISRLPYIGGIRNFYTPIIIINGWFACIYKSMHEAGMQDDVIGYVISEVTDGLFDHVPAIVGKRIKGLVFSGLFKMFIKRQAARSRKMKYPGDWVYTVGFPEWGSRKERRVVSLEFSECGVHKYYKDEGCEALGRYCNFCDPQYSVRYGLGLDAGRTMAQGNEKCTLIFDNSRDTIVPENIRKMSESAVSILNKITD